MERDEGDPFGRIAREIVDHGYSILRAAEFAPFSIRTTQNAYASFEEFLALPQDHLKELWNPKDFGLFSTQSLLPGMVKHYFRYTRNLEETCAKGEFSRSSPIVRTFMGFSQNMFNHAEALTQLLVSELDKIVPGQGIKSSFPARHIKESSALFFTRHEPSQGASRESRHQSTLDPSGLIVSVFEDPCALVVGKSLVSSGGSVLSQTEFQRPAEDLAPHDLIIMAGLGMERASGEKIRATPFRVNADAAGTVRHSIYFHANPAHSDEAEYAHGFE